MKGNTSGDFQRWSLSAVHAVIDLGVEKMHRQGLVTDDGLIVTLCVRYDLFFPSSVCQGVHEMAHAPIFIWNFLEGLNPHVGQEHTKSVIEADTSVSDCPAESWESGHVLSNGDRSWTNFVDKSVCKHEVNDTIKVGLETEVL